MDLHFKSLMLYKLCPSDFRAHHRFCCLLKTHQYRHLFFFSPSFLSLFAPFPDGFKFFISDNGVVLCPGDHRGFIPPKYFKEVYQRRPRKSPDVFRKSAMSFQKLSCNSFLYFSVFRHFGLTLFPCSQESLSSHLALKFVRVMCVSLKFFMLSAAKLFALAAKYLLHLVVFGVFYIQVMLWFGFPCSKNVEEIFGSQHVNSWNKLDKYGSFSKLIIPFLMRICLPSTCCQ